MPARASTKATLAAKATRSPKIEADSHSPAHIRRRLMAWYDRNKRDLPWRRRAHDPYAQWVAEVMLQQTRVETVQKYYEPFLAAFPTVEMLANADHQKVLKCWEGLGYYRRVLNLHRASKLLQEAKSSIPGNSGELRGLPGIGEYTASAIASISFGEPVPAIDGNVNRVIARLFAIGMGRPARVAIKDRVETLLCRRRPGDFNQAMMDFGSLVCTPRSPKCGICPLRKFCAATQLNRVAEFPVTARKQIVPKMRLVTMIATAGDRLLAVERPLGGLWSGCWEFPTRDLGKGESHAESLSRLLKQFDLKSAKPAKLGKIEHILTHRHLTFHVYMAKGMPIAFTGNFPGRWVTRAEFAALPVSTAHRKIFALLEAARTSP